MRVFQTSYRDRAGIKRQTKRFYVELRDAAGRVRRIPAFADKKTSEGFGRNLERLVRHKLANELPGAELVRWLEGLPGRTRATLARVGLLSGARLASLEPLAEHLDGPAGFKQALLAKGDTEHHARKTCRHLRRAFEACRFVFVSDLSAAPVSAFLNELRTAHGLAARTVNAHLRAVKSFGTWLEREGRITANPFRHLQTMNAEADRRYVRRAVSEDEIARLIHAAEHGPARMGMNGEDRAMLYRVALGTGFRRNELASLRPEDFDLDGDGPAITVRAGFSKRRREDRQPVAPELADILRPWLAVKEPGRPVFDLPQRTAVVLAEDLAAARAAWIEEAADAAERTRREGSDYLLSVDRTGRHFDFHATRGQYVTGLVRSGANVKAVQELARHCTPTLTLGTYTHLTVHDKRAALAALPVVPVGGPNVGDAEAGELRATGTDGRAERAQDRVGSPWTGERGAGRLTARSDRPATSAGGGAQEGGAKRGPADSVLPLRLALWGGKGRTLANGDEQKTGRARQGEKPCVSSEKPRKSRRNEAFSPVAELADAGDLKSPVPQGTCGFESRPG